jgi:butyryl-CoA dehydrogenase
MKSFRDKVSAITGAASGIGRALAIDLAGRGSHLALSDIDTDGLSATAAQCEGRGVKVTTARVDVADRAAVESWADSVVSDHGRVNLVVNNAGVAVVSTVEAVSYEDFQWLMGINFWGVVHGTKAFLPHLKASGEGHIVNVSSVFGLMGIPGQSAYNAAKFAVRGFTDSLRIELEMEGACVSATTVHPGGIKTNIARNARANESMASLTGEASVGPEGDLGEQFARIAFTTPEKAARQILAAVERNRRRVLVGPDAKAIDALARLPVAAYQRPMIGAVRRGRRRQG